MAEEAPRARKRGEAYCCVVDCHNSNVNTKGREPPVRFYRFPGKWYEKERRQAWVAAVRRVNPDGTEWRPTAASRVCSAHFVGNRRSNMSDHPAYNPTIFPPVYKKKEPDPEKSMQKWQRHTIEAASSSLDSVGMQLLPQITAEPTLTLLPVETSRDAWLTKEEQEQQADCNDNCVGAGTTGNYTVGMQADTASNHSPIKKTEKRRTIYSSKACQTKCTTVGKLSMLLSMTNGAEACTQVTHLQQTDQVTVTNGI